MQAPGLWAPGLKRKKCEGQTFVSVVGPLFSNKAQEFLKLNILRLIISGSDEERKAVHLAFQFSSRTEQELYDTSVVEDVQFRLETEDRIDPGQSFEVTVVVKNNSEVTREIKVNLAAVLDFYTGVPAKKMKTYKLKFLLNSNAGKAQILDEWR